MILFIKLCPIMLLLAALAEFQGYSHIKQLKLKVMFSFDIHHTCHPVSLGSLLLILAVPNSDEQTLVYMMGT